MKKEYLVKPLLTEPILSEIKNAPVTADVRGKGAKTLFGYHARGCAAGTYKELNNNKKSPRIYEILKPYMDKYNATGVQVNYNLKTDPHKDKGNDPHAPTVTFRFYENLWMTGGELNIEGRKLEIRNQMAYVYGLAHRTHSTEPFSI